MNRIFLVLGALVASMAIACGGGDKNDAGSGDDRPAATATAPADKAPGDDESAVEDNDASDGAAASDAGGGEVAGLLSPLLGLGFGATAGGPTILPGQQVGSGELEQFLLTADDMPEGYREIMSFSMRMPVDVANEFPGGEAAMGMWASEQLQEASSEIPTGGSMLMIMVMQPDDSGSFDEFTSDACSELDEESINESLGSDRAALGFGFKDVEVLDSTGLGDQACGIGLTMDMSGFYEGLQEGFGESASDLYPDSDFGEGVPPEVIDALSAIQMRMRFFGEGDKLGMVMQVGFGADADLADDLAIAQKLRANLP
jgi:hypothetical protein